VRRLVLRLVKTDDEPKALIDLYERVPRNRQVGLIQKRVGFARKILNFGREIFANGKLKGFDIGGLATTPHSLLIVSWHPFHPSSQPSFLNEEV
jgi:hypothetical protein